MRHVKVTYSNNDVVYTSMAKGLTDQEIKDYFKIGRWFNIGSVTDNMQQVKKLEILK